MAEPTGANQQERKAGTRPVRERAVRKQLVSIRHGATIDELAEDRASDGSMLQQRAAVRTVSADAGSHTPRPVGSHFAHDLSRVPNTTAPIQERPGFGYDAGRASMPSIALQSKGIVQVYLAANAPGDRYEQQADRVADEVMRMPGPSPISPLGGEDSLPDRPPVVPRWPTISRIQTQGEPAETVSSEVQGRIERMEGGGQALPGGERSFFESRMGHDFSNVRIHTDSNAVQTSQALSAHAFAVGHHIAFSAGAYQPRTDAGRRLLAHELTHVVQQGAAGVLRKPRPGQWQQNKGKLEVEPTPAPSALLQKRQKAVLGNAKLKKGPTYSPSGPLKATKSGDKKTVTFDLAAEFEHDPLKGIYAQYGQIRQYIQWPKGEDPPNHAGFKPPGDFSPNTWYEDRDGGDKRYGHRSGAHAVCLDTDHYLNTTGEEDCEAGPVYKGTDEPGFDASRTGKFMFELRAIDTSQGDKQLGSVASITVDLAD